MGREADQGVLGAGLAKQYAMRIDHWAKGFDAQRDHDAVPADVGLRCANSTYYENSESFHFHKKIRLLPLSPLRKQLLKEEQFNPMQANEMTEKLTPYDPAEDLASDEAIAIFMDEAFQTNDAGYVAHALGVVARAKGMAQIADQTGLSREPLYRSFSENGNPTLKTTLAVMKALGIELTAKVAATSA